MVMIRITKMLRGWLSMYKQEVGVLLEGLIVKMEELSRRPTRIEWKEEMAAATSSQLAPSGVRSLIDVRSDLDVAGVCNKQMG
jgi:hypothetical protein